MAATQHVTVVDEIQFVLLISAVAFLAFAPWRIHTLRKASTKIASNILGTAKAVSDVPVSEAVKLM